MSSDWKVESGRYTGKDNHRLNLMAIIFLFFLFISCSKIDSTQTPLDIESTKMPNTFIESTSTPIPSSTHTLTPFPTTFAQATIESFDSLCVNSKDIYNSEISPNGQWIAASCYSENESEDSPLQVSRLDGSKTWEIYYRDYANGDIVYSRKNLIIPYRWSGDGRFLYGVSPSNASGCCWIGLRYVLLIRLNLETGEQIPLLGADSGFIFDVIISNSDRYLIFTPPSRQPYDFAILDMKTWDTKQFFIKLPYAFDIYYAVMSPKEDKIILPLFLFNEPEFTFYINAVVVIDLKTGEQRLVISDLKDGEELYPIEWNDEIEVVVASAPPHTWYYQEEVKFWLLNINTGELQETEKPE